MTSCSIAHACHSLRRPRLGAASRWLGAALTALGLVALTSPAEAYCRQRSCYDAELEVEECERDSTGCITEGKELYHSTNCIYYAVAHDSGKVVGLGDAQFEVLVRAAFEAWRRVDCGNGQHPGFLAQSAGVVPTEAPYFCGAKPASNLSVFFFKEDWPYKDTSVGYTHSSYDLNSGVILDADVELNASFVAEVTPIDKDAATLAVVTHEVGHFLGLGHSNVPNAVMSAFYSRNVELLPSLTQDDVDGICAAFPPSRGPTQCPAPWVYVAALLPTACESPAAGPEQPTTGCNFVSTHAPNPSSSRATHLGVSALALLALCFTARFRRNR